jgi:hypothetical protein
MARAMDRIEVINGVERFFLSRAEVTEEEYRAVYPLPEPGTGVPGGPSASGWPLKSDALAVHPSQIAEANERNARAGCSVRYQEDGRAVIPDKGEYRKVLKIEGYHNRDGGYCD